MARMQLLCGGFLWAHTVMLTSLCWDGLSASTSSPTLPTPTLDISSRSRDSVVLVCRAPGGSPGVLFMLYRNTEKVDSQDLLSAAEQVHFTVRMEEWDSGRAEIFCCLYKNQAGHYSAFSPYLQLDRQRVEEPTHSLPSFPPPLLSVEPSDGAVKRGEMLRFRCAIPAPLTQAQSNKPQTFLLLRTAEQTQATPLISQFQASQVSNSEPQPGIFMVGPVGGGEEGEYTCLYQISRRRGVVNSTASNIVQITLTDLLPVPSLVLQQQTDVWHLLCTGSPAYPGAVFSLYLSDNEHQVAEYHAKVIQHQVAFPVPVQDAPLVSYQCRYSVLLGRNWRNSDRSLPVAVTRGIPPPSSPGVDWPLVLGSFSAAVLFLFSLVFVVLVARRRVNTAAVDKKRRQEDKFWTQRHAQDRVIAVPVRSSSFPPEEWSSRDSETESRSSLWSPLSTFTTPMPPIH
ncbi:uncharacterized protein [Nothobranchius furzeri]|uniref:LOC107382220-like protein n=3 Tax=Nothobranchius TaxID=28779 RepID=A0A9D2Y2Q6_NOTFU|nr:putative LOC107382220-like protein [Nothobranchius furzeri]